MNLLVGELPIQVSAVESKCEATGVYAFTPCSPRRCQRYPCHAPVPPPRA